MYSFSCILSLVFWGSSQEDRTIDISWMAVMSTLQVLLAYVQMECALFGKNKIGGLLFGGDQDHYVLIIRSYQGERLIVGTLE